MELTQLCFGTFYIQMQSFLIFNPIAMKFASKCDSVQTCKIQKNHGNRLQITRHTRALIHASTQCIRMVYFCVYMKNLQHKLKGLVDASTCMHTLVLLSYITICVGYAVKIGICQIYKVSRKRKISRTPGPSRPTPLTPLTTRSPHHSPHSDPRT